MVFYKETDFKEQAMIGKVASDWEAVKLEETLLLLRNGLTTTQNKEGNGYPVTRIETISEEDIDPSKVGYLRDLSESEMNEYRLRNGDILFSHINSLDHIGKTAIYEEKPKLLIHGMNLLLLRPDKERIHPRFLLYLFRLYRMKNIFRAMAKKAVNQASINQTELGRVKILRPPLDEQRRIISVLSVVDLVVAKAGEVIAKTEHLKKGLLQTLLTRGIGHKEFKDTSIGKIPSSWETAKLSELSEHITKGTTPTTYGFRYTASGVNFIKIESIDEHSFFIPGNIPHISEEANKAFSRSILKENDVLFSIAGALGRVAVVTKEILPANTNQALAIIRLKNQDRMLVGFLKYFLMGPQIQNFIRTIAIQSQQANINLEHVRNFLVALPPLNEQKKISEILSTVDKKLTLERKERIWLGRVKRGLMNLLLTGKVRVKVD